jgi:hypothetical protein
MNIDGLGKRDKILYAYNKLRNGASKLLMRTENSKQKGILCFGPLQIFSRGRKVTEKKQRRHLSVAYSKQPHVVGNRSVGYVCRGRKCTVIGLWLIIYAVFCHTP